MKIAHLSPSFPPSLSPSLPPSLSQHYTNSLHYLQYSVSFVVVWRCVRNANLCFKTRPMECRDQWRFRGQCVTVDYLYDIITLVCLHKYMKYNALNKLLNFTYIHKYTIKFHCTHYCTVLLLYYTIYNDPIACEHLMGETHKYTTDTCMVSIFTFDKILQLSLTQ